MYLFYYVFYYYFNNELYIATVYSLLTIIAPLIFFCIKLADAKKVTDFKLLSLILKLVLFFGIISIAVTTYTISSHV